MLLKKFLKNRADDEKEEEVSLEELQEGIRRCLIQEKKTVIPN